MASWTDEYWPKFLLAVAIGFGLPEALSLADEDESTQPLTNWTVKHVTGELVMTLLMWAVMHFGIRYVRKH